jgi:GTP-binding protein
VNSSLLNDVIAKAQIATPPPKYRGGRIDLVSAMQTNSQIPTFILYGNDPKYVHLSYSRYLENQIREAFGITNVPITLYFKDKNARNRGFTKKN